MPKVIGIEIFCDIAREPEDFAAGLKIIANDIENGYSSGIAGWSDIVWNLIYDEGED